MHLVAGETLTTASEIERDIIEATPWHLGSSLSEPAAQFLERELKTLSLLSHLWGMKRGHLLPQDSIRVCWPAPLHPVERKSIACGGERCRCLY